MVSSIHNGWRFDKANSRLDYYYRGTRVGHINATGLYVNGTAVSTNAMLDGVLYTFGTDADIALLNRATVLNANTALTGVIVGTPVTPAVAANSLIVGNKTADGDMLFATQTGGNSSAFLWRDASVPATYQLGSWRTQGIGYLGMGAPEQVTIATGVATVTRGYVQLDAEGAGTTDTLDSITATGAVAGDMIRFITTDTDTITFDNSVTMLLGAGTRAVAPGGYIDLQLIGTTWIERGFLTAAS